MPRLGFTLNYIKAINISFSPLWSTPAIREFVQRTSTKYVKSTNPKCEVNIKVVESPDMVFKEIPNKVEVEYTDGTNQLITPERGMHVEEIQQAILRRTEEMELTEELKEMKANPSTGPMPIGFFKGRKGVRYAIYSDDVESAGKGKRAKGGVKTK
uniref:Uncharacterized protein n=1 Tax=Hemiselmis andersenii TaxID=464988 RepID=A0A6T8MW98_HEMAN|mmetsp:Transcript_21236/g.49236  ORF Transcript_21236/g.49236 Transcript_21236/m.49236 type:complete len:156 (+) Transcript_21236:57-524(+)